MWRGHIPWWLAIIAMAMKSYPLIYVMIVAIVSIISAWIIGNHMRRRVKKDLGRAADEGDLTSIETWMKVDEVEEKKNPGRAWAPESSPSDYESTKRDL